MLLVALAGFLFPATANADHTGDIIHFELVLAGADKDATGRSGNNYWITLEDVTEQQGVVFETFLQPTLHLATLEVKPNIHSATPFLFPLKSGEKNFLSQDQNSPVIELGLLKRVDYLFEAELEVTAVINHEIVITYQTIAGKSGESRSFRIRPPPSFTS